MVIASLPNRNILRFWSGANVPKRHHQVFRPGTQHLAYLRSSTASLRSEEICVARSTATAHVIANDKVDHDSAKIASVSPLPVHRHQCVGLLPKLPRIAWKTRKIFSGPCNLPEQTVSLTEIPRQAVTKPCINKFPLRSSPYGCHSSLTRICRQKQQAPTVSLPPWTSGVGEALVSLLVRKKSVEVVHWASLFGLL